MLPMDGTLRGSVNRLDWDIIPMASPENDVLMAQPLDNLYGNTKITDTQIAYFHRKYKGNISVMHRGELHWMSEGELRIRTKQIGLAANGVLMESVRVGKNGKIRISWARIRAMGLDWKPSDHFEMEEIGEGSDYRIVVRRIT